MGKLEDLEKELYGSNQKDLDKRLGRRFTLPENTNQTPGNWASSAKKPIFRQPSAAPKFIKLFLGAMAVLLIAGGATFLFFYLGNKGGEAEIVIQGRDLLESGEAIKIPITYKNISRVDLKDLEVTVALPTGSRVIEDGIEKVAPPRVSRKIDILTAGQEETMEITARIFGKLGEQKLVEATIVYQPKDLQARFSAKGGKLFTIERVPLAISWDAPEVASSGQEVTLNLRYVSDAKVPFENLSLKVDYPLGFTFISSSRKPDSGNNIWKVGTLAPSTEGTISFRGKMDGLEGDVKVFKSSLGFADEKTQGFNIYGESVKDIKIVSSPLEVRGYVGEGQRDYTVSSGEVLNFTLHYRNNAEIPLRNITLRAYLESGTQSEISTGNNLPADSGRNLLDYNSLSIRNGGVFDFQTRAIVWSPSNLADLQVIGPGEEGYVSFNIQTRDSFPIRSGSDRNLVLRLRSSAEVADIPQEFSGVRVGSEDRLDLKVKSKVIFAARASFASSPIPNYGLVPPKVGARTSYTIIWEIRNFSNDLLNTEVRTALPANIKWANEVYPGGVRIVYDQGSGEVYWNIGKIPAGTGVTGPALTGAFQIYVVPSESDLGNEITLSNKSILRANDSFTSESVQLEFNSLTTDMEQEPGKGVVR